MLPETLQLEEMRQQIEDLEEQIQKHTDYIDHGLPAQRQSRKVMKMREQSKQARAKLRSAIDKLRAEKPEAFDEWINFHKHMLERILAEPKTDKNVQRLLIASVVLSNWERVIAGTEEYVHVGAFLLEDYHTAARKLIPQQVPKHNRNWWQFWK